jgi:N,N'-diacetylchitobiose transport system permease protein
VSTVAAPLPPRRRRRRKRFARAGWNALGVLVFAVMAFPVFWMVSTALKTGTDINSYAPKWIPTNATLVNFRDSIHTAFFWSSVKNSLIVVGVTVALSLVLAFLAAVALAKFRFTGRKVFILLMIVIQMLPANALIIPLYVVLARYHQTGRLTGVIITYMTFVLPFSIWTLRGFIMGIPRDLEEAAMVDGNTRFGAFVRILLPLVAPGLVATSIFSFITAWNELIFAYTFLKDQDKATLPIMLQFFFGRSGNDWGPIMAASTLLTLPVIAFFLLVQRRMVSGLVAGAVKG